MDSIILQSARKEFSRNLASFWRKNPEGKSIAIDDVSLRVPTGHALALLGPNGSGKTTLLKLIAGMLLPNSGTVLVEGFDTKSNALDIRKRVGFLIASERSFYPRLTVYENLEFFAAMDEVPRLLRRLRIESLLDQVGLSSQANKLAMQLSSGMYQKLAIARVLLKQPSIILLDEPTRSLDREATEQFWNDIRYLQGSSLTLMAATHNFEEAAALGDSVAILKQGRIVDHCAVTSARQLQSAYAYAISDQSVAALEALA
jgi:ABC-2 type transport system ATP-binding protein